MRENRFNDIHKTGGHLLINAKQLQYAESFVKQLVQTETSVLKDLKALKPSELKAVKIRMRHLSEHTLTILRHRTVYSSQLARILDQVQFKMHKIMIIERFANVKDLVVGSIRKAVLKPEQTATASSEVTSLYQYTRDELLRVQKLVAFRPIFTGGINAMNGALAKYVSKSQMYILNQIQGQANRVEDYIHHQPHLSVMAKYIAGNRVTTALDKAKQDLMTTTNFNGLRSIKHYCSKELQQIANDENRSLNNISSFTKFTNHLTVFITKLSRISADLRLTLKTHVIQRQRTVLTNIQRSNKQVNNFELGVVKHRFAEQLILEVVHGYQHEIRRRNTDLSPQQRDDLIDYLNQAIKRFIKALQKSSSIEQQTKKILYHLSRQMAQRESRMLYRNQVHEVINGIQTQINDQYDLTSADKINLRAQAITYGRRAWQKHLKIFDMRRYLQKWIRIQSKYLLRSSLTKQIYSLNQQIEFSHLSATQRHRLLKRLAKVRKAKSNYHTKSLLVKDISDYGVSLDKSINLHQLTKLNGIISQQIQIFNISPAQGKHLSRNFVKFSQQINGLKQISAIDHLEQKYENRIYNYLCQPKLDLDSLVIKAFRLPIDQAKEACRHIKLTVLDKTLSQCIDDRINRRLCAYLNAALRTDDHQTIKRQLNQIINEIKKQMSWAFSWVKKNYIHQLNSLTLDIYHQLFSYSDSPRKILNRVEGINSQNAGSINNSGDLIHVEQAYQQGKRILNSYSGKLIGQIDSAKAKAHHSVDKMATSLRHQLQNSQINIASSEIKQATFNQILEIVNHTHNGIDQNLDDNLNEILQRCHRTLNHVLRRSYLQEWLRISAQAQLSIQRLTHTPLDPKMEVLQSLQERETDVADKLKSCDRTVLTRILRDNQHYIYQVVRKGIYLNPDKKRLRNQIDQLIVKIKANLNHYTEGKLKSKAIKQLKKLNIVIDRRILNSRAQQLKPLYKAEHKHLMTLEIKAIRKTQLLHFNVHVKKIEHQLHQLPLLSNHESNHADSRFNRYYHQSIYKITHTLDLHTCISSEQRGEKHFKQVLAHYRRVNHIKHRLRQAIIKRAQAARSQIQSLSNLQKKDKHDSDHLLKQIQRQVVQNIKFADGADKATAALNKGRKMVKQVIDKVSSAGVLVSAIKTANHQIASSTLDPKQKKATLHQINQIINNGIQSQFSSNNQPDLENSDETSSKSSNSDHHSPKDETKSRDASRTKVIKGTSHPHKKKKKRHHTFFGF